MKIYFLRHGIAVEAEDWKGNDYDRPLTDEGRKKMAKEAAAIRDLDLELDAILTSPLVRAKDTAEIVAKELKRSAADDERLADDFDIEALEAILRDHADAKALMFVGHEPCFSGVIGKLIGEARLELKKGGLACVELPDAKTLTGELRWLIPPKFLKI